MEARLFLHWFMTINLVLVFVNTVEVQDTEVPRWNEFSEFDLDYGQLHLVAVSFHNINSSISHFKIPTEGWGKKPVQDINC